MGDMADFINDPYNDIMDDCFEVEGGVAGYIGQRKVCKFCGEDGLRWILTDKKKWRLGDRRGVHVCVVRVKTKKQD